MSEQLYDVMDVGIIVLDADCRVVTWNRWMAQAARIPAPAALGRRLEDLFPILRETRLPGVIRESLTVGSSGILTHALNKLFPLQRESGQDLVHTVIVRPLASGSATQCLLQINDVTLQFNRERILRERQNARYHAIVDSAPDAIITTGADRKIQWVNGAAERLFGYAPSELIGREVDILLDPRDRAGLAFAGHGGRTADRLLQIRVRRKQGAPAFFDVSLAGWQADERTFVTSIWRDVSERIAVEAALRDSEGRQRALLEALPQLVWRCNAKGECDYVNPQWEVYTGLPTEEHLGARWLDVLHASDRPAFQAAWESSRKDGAIFDAEVRFRRADGEHRWFKTRSVPVRSGETAITNWFGTATDITDLVEARETLRRSNDQLEARVLERTREHEAMLAQLHEVQKMESLGQLTGGVAHDFNNLLAVVLGNLSLLKKGLPQDPRTLRLLDGAVQGAERGALLTKRLLAFARRQELKPEAVDIQKLLPEMLDFLRQSVGPHIKVNVDIAPDTHRVRIDYTQLELALMNLAVNARDAMPSGGALTIVGRNACADDLRCLPKDLPPGEYVIISVVDTGQGMDEVTLARALEPFFTTKGIGKGTGLGLSMVHGLAAQSGGSVQIASRPAKGTAVTLWLPRALPTDTPDTKTVPAADPATCPTRPLKILLVDDDSLVSRGAANLLIDLGHTVSEAASARQALHLLESAPEFDAVITDFAMPEMTGLDLAMNLRSRYPELPVIMASGYAELPNRAEIGLPWLAKPYTQQELAAVLAAVAHRH